MKYEFFIAKRLHLYDSDGTNRSSIFTLNVAMCGIVLAIVIMIAAVSIVLGFKSTIIEKISKLDTHIRVTALRKNGAATIIQNSQPIISILSQIDDVANVSLVAESPCILKTDNDFNGIAFKGVDNRYDLNYLQQCAVAGNFDVTGNRIIISQYVAERLNLHPEDRITVYFINDDHIKMRRLYVAGIFNTDFEDFDKNVIVGDISVVQSLHNWDKDTGTAIEVTSHNLSSVNQLTDVVYDKLYPIIYKADTDSAFYLSTIYTNNQSYFAWLDLLDTNIIIVLVLMSLVACFALVAGLLIVVLNRIRMIGILKSLGTANRNIRLIFIYLIQKLVLRAILWGNLIGLAVILIQKYFHVIKLDPATYYMNYVPIEVSPWLIVLNLAVFIISALALIAPSYIITSIRPAKTLKFE